MKKKQRRIKFLPLVNGIIEVEVNTEEYYYSTVSGTGIVTEHHEIFYLPTGVVSEEDVAKYLKAVEPSEVRTKRQNYKGVKYSVKVSLFPKKDVEANCPQGHEIVLCRWEINGGYYEVLRILYTKNGNNAKIKIKQNTYV